MKNCTNPNCNNLTANPKYCSKSCAAKHTNVLFPKKKTKKKCVDCGQSVISYKHDRCKIHHQEYKKYKEDTLYQNKTLEEYRNKLSVKGKHPSWLNSHIRIFCRSWNKPLTKLPCANCGYNLHVELCHIKDVSSFSETATLIEVNSKENVIQLCRNCHWEFDNNIIKLFFNKEGFPEFEDLLINRFQLKAPDFDLIKDRL